MMSDYPNLKYFTLKWKHCSFNIIEIKYVPYYARDIKSMKEENRKEKDIKVEEERKKKGGGPMKRYRSQEEEEVCLRCTLWPFSYSHLGSGHLSSFFT